MSKILVLYLHRTFLRDGTACLLHPSLHQPIYFGCASDCFSFILHILLR